MFKQLLKIELIKTRNSSTFWVIASIHTILFMLVILIGSNMNLDVNGINALDFFKPKYLWGTIAWIASWFNLILGVLIIILVGNEIQFGTIKNQLLSGITRNQFVIGKLNIILALTFYIFFLVFITGILTAVLSPQGLNHELFNNFKVVFVLSIQSFSYMLIAMLVAILLKNNGLSIMIYILYFIAIEPIIRLFIPSPIDFYFPIKTISNLTPTPNFLEILVENFTQAGGQHTFDPNTMIQIQNVCPEPSLYISITVTLAYIALFLTTIFLVVRKKDY